ncbi:helix-turn-helix domain-containing protein [Oscillibacter sp.]|uniref:helix-turn-helix domain-containing protein n=1 Tax=Oscillibacter sp. TaxID=1945593 RepID=UPI002D80C436|nr:helix-turn-helix domain-containing protein [Oscillibacter sp.]
MNISDIIKQAREELGMTQEDLAERLEVSRQAVSKWELGASVPSPENLALLEEVLGVEFPAPEAETIPEEAVPAAPSKPPFWNWKRVVLLVLGMLIASALFSAALFTALRAETNVDVPRPSAPYVTGVYFYDENAAPLQTDLGDGWNRFTAGERVLVLVTFEDSPENYVNAVSLFLTPTGTETLDQREQIAVQAAGEGRDFALFSWDIPAEGLQAHLEATLECGGGDRVTKTLSITAPAVLPESPEIPGILILNAEEIGAFEGDTGYYVLEAYGAPFAEVEWTSSDPDVARVANNGYVFIEGPGEAVITASWKDQTAECAFHVLASGEEVPPDYPPCIVTRVW